MSELIHESNSLPEERLAAFGGGFFGYGNWSAPVWFIGIEEAGDGTRDDLEKRTREWLADPQSLRDLRTFLHKIGITQWHTDGCKPQQTWEKLIRILLRLRNQPTSATDVVRFQREQLGLATGDTLLAEISAFPSPNGRTWNYPDWSDVDWLQDRRACFAKWASIRAGFFCEKIDEHKPDVVVFYGTTPDRGVQLIPTWEQIAGGRFMQGVPGKKEFLFRRYQDRLFVVMSHPAARNLPTGYFESVADFITQNHPRGVKTCSVL